MPLYDTSIFVGHFRRNPKTHLAIIRLLDRSWPVVVSSITLFELKWGWLLSRDPARSEAVMRKYLAKVTATLAVDDVVAYRAAEVQAQLRRRNQIMDLRDLLVAATALVHDLPVCTLDEKHFRRVPGLHLEPLP